MQSIGDKWDEIKENIKREYDLTEVSFDTWLSRCAFSTFRKTWSPF